MSHHDEGTEGLDAAECGDHAMLARNGVLILPLIW